MAQSFRSAEGANLFNSYLCVGANSFSKSSQYLQALGPSLSGYWFTHSFGIHPCGYACTNPGCACSFRIDRRGKSCSLSSCAPACAGFIVSIISKLIYQPFIPARSTSWACGGSQDGRLNSTLARRFHVSSDPLIQKDTNEKVPDKPAHLSKYAYGANSNQFIRLRQVHMICPSFSETCSASFRSFIFSKHARRFSSF